MLIESLIDKQDNFEIVREQIAGILAAESVSQMAKAVAASKDPKDWALKVYSEASNPLEPWLNIDSDPDSQIDETPIVNIWFDNSSYDKSASNVSERQKSETVYNIDCYGLGLSANDPAGGHLLGDKASAIEVQRVYRLVRNILMSANYTYLDLRGLVWRRWPDSTTAFQPQLDTRPVQHIQGIRLALKVEFNEFSPQVAPEVLEFVSIDVKRAEDGLITLEADYEYPIV